jgi:nitric oxide reductase large subunit
MKELVRLRSFQHILFWLFLFGVLIGGLLAAYLIKPEKFNISLLLPSIPALFFISRALYKNSNLFFTYFKLITTKS